MRNLHNSPNWSLVMSIERHRLESYRIVIAAIFLLAIPCVGDRATATDAAQRSSTRDLSELLERQRVKQRLPAVAAVVIKGNRIVAEGVAGFRKKGEPAKATLDDRWHLGSCTKSMTATMIGVLVERGKMSWNTTIGEALPKLANKMRPEYKDVTVEMLLRNRGGIAHATDVTGLWPKLWKREGPPVDERFKMAEGMLAFPPRVPPGEYFYSNEGYGIAGHMAETIMGEPWEQLMQELVFEPLGMASAGFGVPWDAEALDDPWGHRVNGQFVPPGPMADNPPAIGPAATVHTSIRDWAKYAIEHLRGARGMKGRLLKSKTYKRLHRGTETQDESKEYACGWNVVRRGWAKGSKRGDEGLCLLHGGSNNSWYVLIWIIPERNYAVLCATNIGGKGTFKRLDAVNWAVIQEIINKNP